MSKIIKCMFFVLLTAVLPLSVHAQQVTFTFAGRNGAQSVPGVGGQRKCILSI